MCTFKIILEKIFFEKYLYSYKTFPDFQQIIFMSWSRKVAAGFSNCILGVRETILGKIYFFQKLSKKSADLDQKVFFRFVISTLCIVYKGAFWLFNRKECISFRNWGKNFRTLNKSFSDFEQKIHGWLSKLHFTKPLEYFAVKNENMCSLNWQFLEKKINLLREWFSSRCALQRKIELQKSYYSTKTEKTSKVVSVSPTKENYCKNK